MPWKFQNRLFNKALNSYYLLQLKSVYELFSLKNIVLSYLFFITGLNFHMLSHKNKHECTICGKQFSLEIMVKNHMATHSEGDSAYACAEDGCDAVFVTQEQLSRHQHTAHDAAKSQKPSAYDEDTEIDTEEEEMNQSGVWFFHLCKM